MSLDLEAMRNNFYEFRKQGCKHLRIETNVKVINRKQLKELAKLYEIKLKFKVVKHRDIRTIEARSY